VLVYLKRETLEGVGGGGVVLDTYQKANISTLWRGEDSYPLIVQGGGGGGTKGGGKEGSGVLDPQQQH